MIQHTITHLNNGNFLLKLTSGGQTVQTTEISKEQARDIANAILADGSFIGGIPVGYCAVKCSNGDMWVRKYNEPSDPKVCGECVCDRQ